MRSIPAHRRRPFGIGLLASGIGILLAVTLGVAGSALLFDSTGGTTIDSGGLSGPVKQLPDPSTALIGVANSNGRLTSVVAIALNPSGTGGAIMPLSASADIGSGRSTTLAPLAATVAQEGADSFLSGSESVTNISFDMAEIVDAERFVALFGGLETIDVDLPVDLSDTDSRAQWTAGTQQVPIVEAADMLGASNAWAEDWYSDPARYAIWKAIAERATELAPAATPDDGRPGSIDEFIERLLKGPVRERGLGMVRLAEDRIAKQLDPSLREAFGKGAVPSVVVHDSAEVAMVGSAVAPGRVGAPLDAARYRVVSGFTESDLADFSFNRSDLTRDAINRLTYKMLNVPSVSLLSVTPPDVTMVNVVDVSQLESIEAELSELFGEVRVQPAEVPIEGIDVEIILGRSYLDTVPAPNQLEGPATMEEPASVGDIGTTPATTTQSTTQTTAGSTDVESTEATNPATTAGTEPDATEADGSGASG